jgi:hypothetical protein
MGGTWTVASRKYFRGKMTGMLLNWCQTTKVPKKNVSGIATGY